MRVVRGPLFFARKSGGRMYGKLFDSMYDGTLVEDWRALITFQQMIILCDADGIIDMTPSAISRRTGIPIEHIKAGIEILENADPYSRTENEEGRRICLIDAHRPWGWYIVNHSKYKYLQDADTVRAQTRERVRKHRAKKMEDVTDVTAGNAQKRHTDTDTEASKTLGQNSAEFDLFWSAYPRKVKKKDAVRVWAKMSTDDMAKARADVEKRIKGDPQWTRDDGKFVPYPATYLNGEQWNDEWTPKCEPMSRAMRASI
jgi:hypothetical protein